MPLSIPPALIAQAAQEMRADPQAAELPKADEAIWPYLLAAVGQGADLATTATALSHGAQEQNPLGGKGVMLLDVKRVPVPMVIADVQAQEGRLTIIAKERS